MGSRHRSVRKSNIKFEELPIDVIEHVLGRVVNPKPSRRLSIRAVTRLYEYSSMIFLSKIFNMCYFNIFTSIIVNRDANRFLNTWSKVYSLIRRCNGNLRELRLEFFDYKCDRSDFMKYAINSNEQLTLPKLKKFSFTCGNPNGACYILNSMEGKQIDTISFDMTYISNNRRNNVLLAKKKFLSRRFLRFLTKFKRLQNLELISFFIRDGFLNKTTFDLLHGLKSLSLIDIRFSPRINREDFFDTLATNCTELTELNLRLQKVPKECILRLCKTRGHKLTKLHLLSHDVDKTPFICLQFSDVDAIEIIRACPNLTSIHISRNDYINFYADNDQLLDEPSAIYLTGSWIYYAVKELGCQLEHIGFMNMRPNENVLYTIANGCPNLKSITMRSCLLLVRMKEFKYLFEKKGRYLESLDIHGCLTIRNGHLRAIMKSVCPSTLKRLNVSDLGPGCTTNMFKKFLQKTCGGLEELSMYWVSSSITTPLPFLSVIQKYADKEKLRDLRIDFPQPGLLRDIVLRDVKRIQREFLDLSVGLKRGNGPERNGFFV